MLKVHTKLDKSTIEGAGIGLFANQDITKDTLVWKADKGWDEKIKEDDIYEEFEEDSPEAKFFEEYCSFEENGKVQLYMDNTRFMNHASKEEDRNVYEEGGKVFASRDIKSGEEILTDYEEFDTEIDTSNFN